MELNQVLGMAAGANSKLAEITNQITNHKNIFISANDPSINDGENGDIWFVVEPINESYYNEGVEGVNWVAGYIQGNGSQSKQVDHLFMETTSNDANGADYTYVTENPVSLTLLKTIYIDYESLSAHNNFGMRFSVSGLRDTANSSGNLAVINDNSGVDSRRVVGIDVSALVGNYYIRLAARDVSPSESRPGQLKVYNVWGEG